jgi:hypothetical protein
MTPKSDPTVVQPLSDEQLYGASASEPDRNALWAETRLVYPVYAAAATQFGFSPLPHPAGELPPNEPTTEIFDRDTKWLDEIDGKIRAFQIRQLPPEILNASEPGLNAFIQRQLRKADKTKTDQDKIDLLLVQYFALCASASLYRGEISLGDVARVLQPVLLESDSTQLEWCQPLDEILQQLERCQSLRDLMEAGLVEKGRVLKDSAGCMFYDPAALVAFCRFNFLLRRAFIRLLHADLSAVSQAIEALRAKGVKSVDCRRAGFSAAETTTRLRYFCENWRQPFHRDYTESSVRQAFEQLLALRTDLEEAFANFAGPATSPHAAAVTPLEEDGMAMMSEGLLPADVIVDSLPKPHGDGEGSFDTDARQENENISGSDSLDTNAPKPKTRAWGSQECLEAIWGQLKAAPPSHTSSMFTVRLEDTKVLLSSWEGEAFLKPIGEESEDLRRAVVARALVAVAMDERKRSGERKDLDASLLLARAEVGYFQGRVEQAKGAKNMEAAVNLGISTKRIRSVIEEAEKL